MVSHPNRVNPKDISMFYVNWNRSILTPKNILTSQRYNEITRNEIINRSCIVDAFFLREWGKIEKKALS